MQLDCVYGGGGTRRVSNTPAGVCVWGGARGRWFIAGERPIEFGIRRWSRSGAHCARANLARNFLRLFVWPEIPALFFRALSGEACSNPSNAVAWATKGALPSIEGSKCLLTNRMADATFSQFLQAEPCHYATLDVRSGMVRAVSFKAPS